MSETVSPAFSDVSAQDTALAAQEAQEWIEAVTGRTFGSSFRKSLEDGVILCELMIKLYPDSIRRINRAKSPIAHLDNIQQFLFACKDLGLKDAQLFDKMDLQEAKGIKATGVKRNEADRRIRSVCITLYWLGQAIAEMEDYNGPQLDLDAFKRIMYGSSTVNNVTSSNGMTTAKQEQPNHFKLEVEKEKKDVSSAVVRTIPSQSGKEKTENGHTLTSEQEQTADQLLADIQSAVDELLLDFQLSPVVSPEPPSPAAVYKTKTQVEPKEQPLSKKVGMTITMNSINGGFGFRIVGGRDINAEMTPQVDLVAPGMAADRAGLKEGDELVSVNKQDVSSLTHEGLVSMIKQAGVEGSVMLGVIRNVQSKGNDPPKYNKDEVDSAPQSKEKDSHDAWVEQRKEQERQAQEIALLYRRGGPPPTVGSQPLPPLVEHQEESVLEQINELLESTPVPLPHSPSPSPPPSPPTPTISPPHLFSEKQATRSAELQDDRETIERELKELALMEMAKPPEQSEEELSLASSGQQSGSLHLTAESQAVPEKTETDSKVSNADVKEEINGRSLQPPPQKSESKEDKKLADVQAMGDDKELERHLQELMEFSEMPNEDIVSLSMVESPPPPPPQTEAPKRQVQATKASSPPATRPKPVRKAPSPPKQKSNKKASSKKSNSEESILSQKTRLPSQTEVKQQSVSKTETDGGAVESKQNIPQKPVPSQQKEMADVTKKVEAKQPERAISPTGRKLVFTPPPPPTSPPSSPSPPEETNSATEESRPKVTEPTPVPVDIATTANFDTAVNTVTTANIVTPVNTVTPVDTMIPLMTDTPVDIATAATPITSSSGATPSRPTESSPSTPYTPTQAKSTTGSEGSYHKEEMRTLTSEDVEIIGGMKISRVQRTKWTPKGSLTEFVTSPTTPIRGPFQEQFQQHYSYPMQNGAHPESGRSEPQQHKPSRRSEAYKQRYSQPERVLQMAYEDERLRYQPSQHGMQQRPPAERQPTTPQWRSQEELRIKHPQQPAQQNHSGQMMQQPHHQHQPQQRRTPPQQHHHQPHQHHQPHHHHQQQQQYTANHQSPQQAGNYRQGGVSNGHAGAGGYRSASLPRNKQEDWRVHRSKTWSAVDRSVKDGPQPAYAVKASNPYELCSRCHQVLGGGPVMAIPGAKTQYHLQCFVCRVCRNPLIGTVPKNTLVIMKSRHPHCHRCVSNSKDTVMTEC